jgi:hypothetical protein
MADVVDGGGEKGGWRFGVGAGRSREDFTLRDPYWGCTVWTRMQI